MPYQDALARIIEDVIAPGAAEVDAGAVFPRRQIEALAGAGLLGLTVPTSFGGGGEGLRAASHVVGELGAVCGSTAMVVTMHYAATAALVAGGVEGALAAIAAGRHLSTLAFSEVGSRSHFWAPLSTAAADGGDVRLDARKSWVTAAGEADSYVWSSLPVGAGGPMTLWLLRFLHRHAPDPVTADVTRLALRDEARHVAFGVAHTAHAARADPGYLGVLRQAVERRHAALLNTAGLGTEVFDALVLLAAGSWEPEAISRGWRAVQLLQQTMDEGRRRRLAYIGFPAGEAVELSALHTRNFM